MSTKLVYAYLRDQKGVCRAACLFQEVTVEIENKSTESLMPPEVHLIYAWVVLNPQDQDYRPEAKDRLLKRFIRAKNRAIYGHRNFGRPFRKYRGDVKNGSCIVQKLESLGMQKIGWSISSGYFSGRLLQMREFVAGLGVTETFEEGISRTVGANIDVHRDLGFKPITELGNDEACDPATVGENGGPP